ncbi:MAG TPA: hypothetical protein VFT64_07045 [Rickettsiales bacterium]|nr:hypothetical protein [Rickettsiales bacterium]
MSAACPSCNTIIPWYQQRPHLACPLCGSALSSNIQTLLLVSVMAWVLANVPLLFLDDNTPLGFWMTLLSSIVLGAGIFYVIIERYNRLLLRGTV